MIKVFGTTGTTSFSELIIELDKLSLDNFEITCQIADIEYKPVNISYFRFTKNISSYFSKFDVFVCHAGQGTIYTLLELGKKIIVVPNPKLKDNHQEEICRFVEMNNYGFVAWQISDVKNLLPRIVDYSFNSYTKRNSEIASSIVGIIKNAK